MTEEIINHERYIWDALVAGDAETDIALLHPDFIGVYPDGFAGRDGHVAQLTEGPTIASYSLHDIVVKALGADHALICYRARFQRTGDNRLEQMFVSSIWRKHNLGWINIFSQDTPSEQ